MKMRLLCVAIAVTFLGVSAFAQGNIVYNSVPTTLAGNYVSQPFQAQQVSEFGDRIAFAPGGRNLLTATVTMSSWGCQSGAWFSGDCVSAPGATFAHPITLNIYEVGTGDEPGALIGTVTQTFNIPYRPSANPTNCTGGRWYEPSTGSCFNGYASNITFNLGGLVVPDEIIFGVVYNTSNYGPSPMGPQACGTNCPYDSLNVALGSTVTVGTNPAPDDAYFNTITAGWYCDGGAGGTGAFRLDSGCWTGFKPFIRIAAANPPANGNACKNNGWRTATRLNGTFFRNQGDCMQYVNTGN
jgi:hypothetical protein